MNMTSQQQLLDFIRLLMTAAANASLYNLNHRQVDRLNRQALGNLRILLKAHGELSLKVIEKQLIFDNRPVAHNLTVQRLITALGQYHISHLRITPGIKAEELLGLVSTLSKRPESLTELPESEHIQFSQIEVRYRSQESKLRASELLLTDVGNKEAQRHMGIYQAAKKQKRIEIDDISEIVSGFVNAFTEFSDVFLALAPLRSKDEYTYTHSTNICLLNLAQARQLGIEGQMLNDIGIAAMLHDVGKMFVPQEVLSKTEKLTEDEWQLMQQHPQLGAEYLLSTPGVPRLAVVTAYEHHMQYNGQGYLQNKRPWKINICSHMTAISDTYDAMRTRRSYEASLELTEIIDIMLNLAGTKLHPQLTYNFLRLLDMLEKEGIGNPAKM